jgi:hypothetical protein
MFKQQSIVMHIECLPVPSSLRFALANVVVTLSGRISSFPPVTVTSEAVHDAGDIKSAIKKPIARQTALTAIPIKVKQGGNLQGKKKCSGSWRGLHAHWAYCRCMCKRAGDQERSLS